MNTNLNLNVTEIQRFCMHDGPGVRTTVFLKGCPLNCKWCHNPETKKAKSELLFYKNKCILCGECVLACKTSAQSVTDDIKINRLKCVSCFNCVKNCPTGALSKSGQSMAIDEILSVVKKDMAFYGEKGGVTLSGGEPFMQGEGVIELLDKCKQNGISTAVETCGYVDFKFLEKAVNLVDVFLWDIKDTDDERHKKYTGVSNKKILENLNKINELNAKIRLRCILVNGVNTNVTHYENLLKIAKSINNFDGIDILPYHAFGGAKSLFLGEEDSSNCSWIPTNKQIQEAENILLKNIK